MRAASVRHDFRVNDETRLSAEQMDISGRYEVEIDSQDPIDLFHTPEETAL